MRMSFNGDFDVVAADDQAKEELERCVCACVDVVWACVMCGCGCVGECVWCGRVCGVMWACACVHVVWACVMREPICREVTRTILGKYKGPLGLKQDQITALRVGVVCVHVMSYSS